MMSDLDQTATDFDPAESLAASVGVKPVLAAAAVAIAQS